MGMVFVCPMAQYVLRFNRLRELQKFLHSANGSRETCNRNCGNKLHDGDWSGKEPLASTPNLLLRADSVKRQVTLAPFYCSGTFCHHHNYSKIKNGKFSQHLWMHSIIFHRSFKIFLTWFSFTEGKHEFFQIFPLAWEARDLSMSALAVKTEAKQELSTSAFLHGLGCQVPHPIQQQSNVFLAFLLLLMHAQQLFLPFSSLTRFNSQWALAFLTLSLHTHCLYIPCIICPCFHFLYASFCASVLSGGICSTIWISYHFWLA